MDPTIAEKMMLVSENWHHWNDVDLLKAVFVRALFKEVCGVTQTSEID